MEHILEHVDLPVVLLMKVKEWLMPGGKILIGVLNGNYIHRLVAVKMGLLKQPCELNYRDQALGHRRVYTQDSLRTYLYSAELHLIQIGVYFLSHCQISKFKITGQNP